ncbi:MAG TPA: HAMP domain-containing sensor histidine kinase [Chitinophagaceae bacterium]
MQNKLQVSESGKELWQQYIEFIELAAHDLQAPLRKLSVLTERLTNKYAAPGNEDTQEYVQRINTCIGDMRNLIDGFSEFASLNTNITEPVACDLDALIKRILHELGTEITEKDIRIEKTVLPVVDADKNQIYQLFKKIVENVFKFAKYHTPLTIHFQSHVLTPEEKLQHSLDTSRSYHKIEIEDNGIGFKQQYAEKIFHPLVRLNGKSGYPGIGLGLAMCEKIVSNHQGIIYGEGIENEGARFTIILPEKFN